MKNIAILLLLGTVSQAIVLRQKDVDEEKALAEIVSAINADTQEQANNEIVTDDTKDARGSADI